MTDEVTERYVQRFLELVDEIGENNPRASPTFIL